MEKGICKGCKKETFIQNKTLQLCPDCVYKKNHGGKDRLQVYKERQVAKPAKTKRYVYKPKATGEREMFLEIWEEREHFCTNCGVYLGEVPHAFMFAHVEAKSLNGGKKRLERANVELHCAECHYCLDHGSKEMYNKRKGLYERRDN